MSGGVPTRLHAQHLPQGKEKLLLRHPLSQKNKLFTSASTFNTQTESHEANITVESPSKWTSTSPVGETSESIEPNDTDLELNAIGYTFSKIL